MTRSLNRTPRPTELVAHVWLGRVEAEYRSAAITQHLVLWLLQIGASPDLVRLGLRIVNDELVHAELSRKVWLSAGGDGTAAIDRGTLGLTRTEPHLEGDVVAAVVRVFCLGETVAVPLFANLRRGTTVPVARRAYDRILKDEVRHRDFGWIALAWLLARPDHVALRSVIHAGLPSWLGALERSYGEGLVDGIRQVTLEERAWGVAPAREYATILHRTYAKDYRARFAKLDIAFPAP